MKHKTMFRLFLKAIGVWLFFEGICEIPSYIVWAWYGFTSMLDMGEFDSDILYFFVPFVRIGAGVYLFFGGRWITDLAIPGNRPYCHECGYDLTGAIGHACAECGTPFRHPQARPAARESGNSHSVSSPAPAFTPPPMPEPPSMTEPPPSQNTMTASEFTNASTTEERKPT